MNTTHSLLLTSLLAALAGAACSSSTTTFGSDTDASTAHDSGSGGSMDPAAPQGDSGAPSSDAGSHPSADAGPGTKPSCMSPADCSGGTGVCCGTIPITGGTVPNCTTGGVMTKCTAESACATTLGTSCSGTQTVRLCASNSDCMGESNYNQCCTFSGGDGGSLSFCANSLIATFGGGSCQ